MGKLAGCVIYEAGPIDASLDGGVSWRRELTPELQKMGCIILDPTDKPTDDFKEDENIHKHFAKLKSEGKYKQLHDEGRQIRNFDLRCCDKADIIIAFIDTSITMCGTYEEIFNANQSKKPVLIFCKQGKEKIPNWIYWTVNVDHVFNDIDELVNFLIGIDIGLIQPNGDYFKFFDWKKLLGKSSNSVYN
jgi:nucleoside 2-deoxyribosyltransferase